MALSFVFVRHQSASGSNGTVRRFIDKPNWRAASLDRGTLSTTQAAAPVTRRCRHPPIGTEMIGQADLRHGTTIDTRLLERRDFAAQTPTRPRSFALLE